MTRLAAAVPKALALCLVSAAVGFALTLAFDAYRAPEMTYWLADWSLCG